jgi:hypothetical protein
MAKTSSKHRGVITTNINSTAAAANTITTNNNNNYTGDLTLFWHSLLAPSLCKPNIKAPVP